jgi:DNA repair exonuclease SbcCD nuclease subunit
MNALFIGDLHANTSSSNLEDVGEIFKLVDETLEKDQTIQLVCFVGDIFHTHAVVRQEPAFYVRRQFERLIGKYKKQNRPLRWIALAGNHDYSTPSAVVSDNSVRLVLGDLVEVVDDYRGTPIALSVGPFTFVPFMGDNDEFIRVCNMVDHDTILVCHQTFDGSKYENQHTAPNGVKQNLIPQKYIISGHIHMTQILKNGHNTVFYIGTPRSLNANEMNQCKYIWKFDGLNRTAVAIKTDERVKQYIGFTYYQGAIDVVAAAEGESRPWKQKDDVRIYVEGNEEFYEKVLAANKHLEGEVRFIPNIKKEMSRALDVESNGSSVETALRQYVYDVYDMSDDMRDAVWQRLQTWMPKLGTRT